MTKTTATITAILAIFALSAMAFAGMYGGHGSAMFTKNLGDMDANADAVVTFEEYEAFHSKDLRAAFSMLDANGDNVIDKAEWEQFLAVHGMHKTM